MSAAGKIVYLVTGANRGIGYGLANTLAARPDAIVFAGARDPAAQSLVDLAAKHPNVHPVKFVANDQANNEAAVAEIKSIAGQLDVIVANAGIAKHYGPVAAAPLSEFKDHWEINTLGTVVLFQAAHDLLLASPTGAPIFAYISTATASMARFFNFNAPAYASSKAAANFVIKALDAENPKLIAFAINPGWVQTELGNGPAAAIGLPQAPVTLEDSVSGILSRIDEATKEKSSGKFWNYKAGTGPFDIDLEEIPW